MAGRFRLADFKMLAACGGFSYGDVLGAGEGWAKSILFHPALRDQFAAFFADPNTLTLGVCNGCQMVSNLAEIIPGAETWPKFKRNLSEQFEARLSMVHVPKSASLILNEIQDSSLPVVISHGEAAAPTSRFTAAIFPPIWASRCNMWTVKTRLPKPIRSTPTARRRASPALPTPTAALPL